MSLTCTNEQLLIALGTIDAPAGLVLLAKRDIRDIKASYAITKAIRKAGEHLAGIEKDRQAAGGPTHAGELPTPEFLAKWQVILADTVTLEGVRAVTLAELDGSGATPQELLQAGPFINSEGE